MTYEEKSLKLKKVSNDILNCALDLIDFNLIDDYELNDALVKNLLDIQNELILAINKK